MLMNGLPVWALCAAAGAAANSESVASSSARTGRISGRRARESPARALGRCRAPADHGKSGLRARLGAGSSSCRWAAGPIVQTRTRDRVKRRFAIRKARQRVGRSAWPQMRARHSSGKGHELCGVRQSGFSNMHWSFTMLPDWAVAPRKTPTPLPDMVSGRETSSLRIPLDFL